jgi:CubicO group peptidase (beta-lactamase class C family)
MPESSKNAGVTSQVDALFSDWDQADAPGAALAVIQNGEVVYKRGYGMANLEYAVPITPTTIFHAASLSKQFTSFAINLLALEGKLSLDDELHTYFPDFGDFGSPITLRNLRHHTSGLRDQWDLLQLAGWRMEDVITEQDILDLARKQQDLNFDPGSEYLYCNTAYTLLAVIVKRVSGMTFREFTQDRIFTPLGMTNTHFHDDHRTIVPNRAYSYAPREVGEGFENSILSFANVGTTSLFTSVEDLARWDQNSYDARVGGVEAGALLHERFMLNDGTTIGYAAGLMIGEYRGLKTVGHSGADAGYRAHIVRFPEERFTVIILANRGDANPGALSYKIADLYLADRLGVAPLEPPAQPAASKNEKQIDPEQLAEYTGDFFSDELTAIYTLRACDGKLMLRTRKGEQPLSADEQPDTFTGEIGTITFVRTRRKRIIGFKVTTGRVRNLRFRKTAKFAVKGFISK